MTAAALSHVGKSYPTSGPVLHDVSFSISPGERLAIVGPSGSGKSTLLHILGTLDRPDQGTVEIAGQSVETMDDRQLAALRADSIGFVFQQFFLMDALSARENVEQGLIYGANRVINRGARAVEALERVGLSARLDHRPSQLSGGERQRVAIARAIVRKPALLLADEPTGNLDSQTGREIITILRELTDIGSALVVITHDSEVAGSLERRITIRDGRIEADG